MDRRAFLRTLSIGVATLAVSACGSTPTATPVPPTPTKPAPTAVPALPTATKAPAAAVPAAQSPFKPVNIDAMVALMHIQEKNWAPKKGGVLRASTDGQPPTLDPHTATTAWCTTVTQNIFDQLVSQGPDGEFYPWLASSWEVSSDGLIYTFKLRNGVKFHDGTPFNAEAVKFNIDRLIDPNTKTGLSTSLVSPIKGAAVKDEHTVAIELKTPTAVFLLNISDQTLGMVSPAGVKKWGQDFGRHPVGTGAYVFKEWKENLNITLGRNEDYQWPPPFYRNQGPAFPDQMLITPVMESGTRIAAMLSDEIDWYARLGAPDDYRKLESDSRFRVFKVVLPGVVSIRTMNTSLPPLDDVRVRRAFMYACDKTQWFKAGGEFWPIANNILAPTTFAYNADVENMYPYDPAKAAQLLDEVGWKMGNDGYRYKDGAKLKILYCARKPEEILQAMLKKVGVEIQFELMEMAAWLSAMHTGEKYHMSGMAGGNPDPILLDQFYHSANVGKATFQWSVYKNKALDVLLEKGRLELDREKRAGYYREVQRILMEDAVAIPTTASGLCYAVGPKLHGNVWVSGKQMEYLHDAYIV